MLIFLRVMPCHLFDRLSASLLSRKAQIFLRNIAGFSIIPEFYEVSVTNYMLPGYKASFVSQK
jgi:hypothetical protein